MRNIKFRAWNILTKKMQSWGDIFDLPAWEIFPGTPEQRPYEIMQYTGLKDRKGTEIYEGDIVKDGNVLIGYVSFLIQEAGFVVVLKNSDYRLGHRNTAESYTVANGHEVIGNIYENPELLNG